VKHWQETAGVLGRVVAAGRDGKATALATVTRIQGSAYRRPGAKLLIEEDGAVLGGVSGGCLEEDVRQVGLKVLRSGESRVLHYETGDDESRVWGLGLGCDGQVDLVVQPISPEAAVGAWARVRALLDGDSPFALATIAEDGASGGVLAVGEQGRVVDRWTEPAEVDPLEGAVREALRARRTTLGNVGSRRVFAEVLSPPPRLIVCGAGDDASPLVALATSVGFRVFVVDHRRALLDPKRLPEAHQRILARADEDSVALPSDADTYAVVMTHSLRHDTAWVRRLIAAPVAYVGALGPRARTQRILAELGTTDARVFGPVGLDIGADGPEQVALSVVAELLAVRSRREPRHLRERELAVHADD
jgi:xanthine/CO dehydrogenase XdhC/CoxF family maturation factor